MRASSLWISASVGALLWAAGCPAARADACASRGQGRGSCGCDMWNSVMCSSSGGLQKTSVPVAGRLHASTPRMCGAPAALFDIAESIKAKERIEKEDNQLCVRQGFYEIPAVERELGAHLVARDPGCFVQLLQLLPRDEGNETGATRQDVKLSMGEALVALSAGGGMCRSP